MASNAIEALSEEELEAELTAMGTDVTSLRDSATREYGVEVVNLRLFDWIPVGPNCKTGLEIDQSLSFELPIAVGGE